MITLRQRLPQIESDFNYNFHTKHNGESDVNTERSDEIIVIWNEMKCYTKVHVQSMSVY